MAFLGNHCRDPFFGFFQLLGHSGKVEIRPQGFRPLDTGHHRLCNPLVVPELLRECGSARPRFQAADISGIFRGSRPIANLYVLFLLLRQGLQKPVKAAAAVFHKLHDQPGIAAVSAAELPVVKELNFIHLRHPVAPEKVGVDMAEVNAVGPVVFLHHGLDHPDRNALLRQGAGQGYTGVSCSHHHNLRFQCFCNLRLRDWGRGCSPGCFFLHCKSLLIAHYKKTAAFGKATVFYGPPMVSRRGGVFRGLVIQRWDGDACGIPRRSCPPSFGRCG